MSSLNPSDFIDSDNDGYESPETIPDEDEDYVASSDESEEMSHKRSANRGGKPKLSDSTKKRSAKHLTYNDYLPTNDAKRLKLASVDEELASESDSDDGQKSEKLRKVQKSSQKSTGSSNKNKRKRKQPEEDYMPQYESDSDNDKPKKRGVKGLSYQDYLPATDHESSAYKAKLEAKFTSSLPWDKLWSNTPAKPKSFGFTGKPGLKVKLNSDATPFDFFKLFFDDSLLKLVADATNVYAERKLRRAKLSKTLTKSSRLHEWKSVTVRELKIFFAISINMGLVKKPQMADYWTLDPLMQLPIISEQMSRNRYQEISTFMSFSTATAPKGDKLHLIRPVLDHLMGRIEEVYYPGREVAIDESMMNFRGKLSFKQYIKTKAHKNGVKLYILAEPNGFVYNLIPYSGTLPDEFNLGQSGAVVLHLMKSLLDKGHSLYMDNFYNSVALCQLLLTRKTYVTGTLQGDRRGLPTNVVGKNAPKLTKEGEFVAAHYDGIYVCKFFDKREVTMISTEFETEMVEITNNRGASRPKPVCVKHYNKHMGGIDRSDQMLAYYDILRKGTKWHRKLFMRLLDICVHNSHVLYNNFHKKKLHAKQFRVELVRSMYGLTRVANPCATGPSLNKKIYQPNVVPGATKTSLDGHKLIIAKTGRCVRCQNRNVTSTFVCSGCPNLPHLCMKPGVKWCYLEHHSLL